MRNPLTFRVESKLGVIYISLLSLFFIGLMLIAVKNFHSDIDILTVGYDNTKVRRISPTELYLLKDWIKTNNIEFSEGQGYKYLLHRYPDRPWLKN